MSTARTPDTARDAAPPGAVSFRLAFRYWLKLGCVSFGGPAGQIAIMHQELVERRRWISERRFLHALNYCMLLPGPEATQLATYIGWLMHGTRGGIVAGVMFVLPSVAVLILLSWIYMAYQDVTAVAAVLYGIKPAVTAIVAFAAYRIGSRALKNTVLWAIAAAAFVAIFVFNVPFPYIVLAAGLAGLVGGRVAPAKFEIGGAQGGRQRSYGPALIDDATPPPPHARFSSPRAWRYAAVGLFVWAAVEGLLVARYGWHGMLAQMGWFFTKAALLTFGGAYAVLPYVHQGSVEYYQWITTPQMIDGLALGETTPGPLIMVVAFVGFVGAWSAELFGPQSPLAAGTAGALVATFFTFVPSFLFILVGAPAVERTRDDIKFTAPLTGITAAVVGVVLNLAAFFAYHVFWPQGWQGGFEWFSALIGAAGLAALWRYRVGVVPVIAASAVAGVFYRFVLQPLSI